MKGRMTIVGGNAWSSHKQNNNEISPENLQVSTSIKKISRVHSKSIFPAEEEVGYQNSEQN